MNQAIFWACPILNFEKKNLGNATSVTKMNHRVEVASIWGGLLKTRFKLRVNECDKTWSEILAPRVFTLECSAIAYFKGNLFYFKKIKRFVPPEEILYFKISPKCLKTGWNHQKWVTKFLVRSKNIFFFLPKTHF